MPMACKLSLPIPPSLNNAYANAPGRGRVATKALRQWKEAAGWELKTQPRQSFAGKFRIELQVPSDMRGDLDNRSKAACDLLTEHRIIPDDRYAWEVTARRVENIPAGRCFLIVEAA